MAVTSIDEYLAAFPAERRAVLESLRRAIRAAAPDATETIAYQIPTFRSPDGRFLVSFAGYRDHYSVYPASGAVLAACGAALTPYLAGKATIRFRVDEPIPMLLVTRVIEARIAEHAGQRS